MADPPEGFSVDQGAANLPAGFSLDQKTKPQVGALEAVGRGAEHGLTFGMSPAIKGAQEASGLPDVGDFFGVPLNALAGSGRMLTDWALGHPDPSVRDSYERGRQAALKSEQLAQEQHPYAYMGGVLAGSLATPGFGAARGVTAAGRIAHGMGAGAAGAGAYGLGESISEERSLPETAKAVGTDVGLGGLFGTAGSAALETLRPMVKGAASMIRAIRDPEAEASRQLVQAASTDVAQAGKTWQPLTSEETAAAAAAGTPRAIVDVMGPQTRALGEWAASVSPQAARSLEDLTQERFKQQAPRVARFVQDMTGGGDLAADVEAINRAGKTVNRSAYAKAYNDSNAQAMWHEGFEQIMQSPDVQAAAREAARTGANKAAAQGFTPPKNPFVWDNAGRYTLATEKNGQQILPNLKFWDAVKQNLDDKIGTALRAGEKGHAGDLITLKNQLVTHLDDAVPAYAQARQGASSFFGAENALEAGANFVRMKDNVKLGDARAAYAKMTPAEQQLFARGYATQLSQQIINSGDTRNLLNATFLANDTARQKTLLALGPQNARQLEALLRAEQVVNSTRGLHLGSPTARRLALQSTMGVGAGLTEYMGDDGFNLGHVLGAASLPFLAGRGHQMLNQRVAQRLGTMLVSDDPAVLAKGVQLASRNPTMFNALRQATASGARVGAEAIEEGGQKRAHGGSVTGRSIQPPLKGARKSQKDGKWYVPDPSPSRRGKYLRVAVK